MLGTPCQACCKVKLTNGHIGIAGSTEMPTVMEFEGHDARLFVWRYRKAWCVKKAKPRTPPDAAKAPRLLGAAKIPGANATATGDWNEPELQRWRGLADFFHDACLKQGLPRSRACSPTKGKAPPSTFVEKTVELGRKMQEPRAPQAAAASGWRPAGVAAAWGTAGPAWGSWGPAWGKQPRSLSLPTLRSSPSGKARRKRATVTTKEIPSSPKKSPDAKPIEKEFRFVARAMNDDTAKPAAPVSLESAMAARQKNPWRKPKPALPTAISDLIGFGDVLFEPPGDECSTMASTMSAPTLSWEDSRSNLRDGSRSLLGENSIDFLRESSCDTVHLPDILPKAKPVKHTTQASPSSTAPARNETRAAAEKRAGRELVQASWRVQYTLSPVKVSIGHMLL